MNSILDADFSEEQWVDQITKNFDDEIGIDIENISICVFDVPKSIRRFKPEAYVPRAIALGPYHHFEAHLYQMERYKVAIVKEFLNPNQVISFESLVIDRLKAIATTIRACYHKYMDIEDDTLAWIVAIDGLFLLDLLSHYGDVTNLIPKKLMNNSVIYRDVMVLENQIPLIILTEIRKSLCLSSVDGDHELFAMLRGFCEAHSPLKLSQNFYYRDDRCYFHLLDLMYHLIVENQSNSKLGTGEKVDKPIKVVKGIPWESISNLLGHKINKKLDDDHDDDDHMEIEIHSVSSLSRYGGINFSATSGGIRDIKFVEREATLYLPIITIDVYSEIVLRNLVTYEVTISNSTLELAQYVELMSGIVNTEADAMLLKEKGIIKGNLSNKDIMDLFNGMKKSSGSGNINKTIEQINEYFYNRPTIKAWRLAKKHIRVSREVIKIVSTILVCILMLFYSFCEVYGCPRLFDKST